MKTDNKLIGTGLLTAIAASLCCITPVLALIAGTSGLASTFSWLEPFRPYFIGLTILVLAFAWYQKLKPQKKIERTVTVKEARELLIQEESSKLVNDADIHSEALRLAESSGIIFLDEIDKVSSKSQQSGEVSREGVQRDILPIVEGSQVNTKYGTLQTDHILFSCHFYKVT